MITTDYHTHSNFSADSDAELEDMVRRAVRLGLTELAVTDHQDYPPDGATMFTLDVKRYVSAATRLKELYSDRIRLLLGLEIGLSVEAVQEIDMLLDRYPFEFVIGSFHDPPAGTFYTGTFFTGKSKRSAYREYFELALKSIRSVDGYDVFGHLDYIPRYGIYPDNSLAYADYADIIDEILKELISRGKGLEVNTSGYRYGLNTVHPQIDILKRYRELGGEILTIGSDAHRPSDLGADLFRAEAALREAGFRAYTLFRNRKPVWKDF